jgi:hypothetical protein
MLLCLSLRLARHPGISCWYCGAEECELVHQLEGVIAIVGVVLTSRAMMLVFLRLIMHGSPNNTLLLILWNSGIDRTLKICEPFELASCYELIMQFFHFSACYVFTLFKIHYFYRTKLTTFDILE